jgi:hypothetical protein
MNKTATQHPKTRCFFANLYFRESVCDSNHKKRFQKSSTIPTQRINGLPPLETHLCLINFEKETSMTNCFDQTFMLTTSFVVKTAKNSEARIPQSALATVRSVECGLFA